MPDSTTRQLRALIGCSDEWMSRSLESLFNERNYEATRVASGKRALKLVRRGEFDVVLLDESMTELSAVEVCLAVRDDPLFDHSTPIVVISSAHATNETRAAAYTAGAWEYCKQPLDVESLFLKLRTFLRARDELIAAGGERFLDSKSGLYTPFGLEQLAEQLEARAIRNHEPFACVAFSTEQPLPDSTSGNGDSETSFPDLARLVREQARRSDVIAKMGESEMAVLAPDTDAAGARLLVARLQREIRILQEAKGGNFRLRAGYCAVADLALSNLDLNQLVQRAETALHTVPNGEKTNSAVSFDDL